MVRVRAGTRVGPRGGPRLALPRVAAPQHRATTPRHNAAPQRRATASRLSTSASAPRYSAARAEPLWLGEPQPGES
eukprot:scaffold78076_cov54-Phaeocystis_antarctica.AAC.1